jgi:hypothetical protein
MLRFAILALAIPLHHQDQHQYQGHTVSFRLIIS